MAAAFSPSGVITLLTDFGLCDPFVGVVTGAILSRFPAARVVDLCHGIQPQAIAEAAFWLERCYPWFPPGTVHVAVVDPGVGSARRILAAASSGHCFLVPDNGLLGPALLADAGARVVAVEPARLGLRTPSATFHGRDVFAPLAALLASGARDLDDLGAAATPLPCVLPAPSCSPGSARGQVVTIDRFGNLISNVGAERLDRGAQPEVLLLERRIPVLRTYSDVEPGQPIALVNAFGVLEVALRDGDAAKALGVGRGAPFELVHSAPGARAASDAR